MREAKAHRKKSKRFVLCQKEGASESARVKQLLHFQESQRYFPHGVMSQIIKQVRANPTPPPPPAHCPAHLPRLLQNSPTMLSGLAVGIWVSPVKMRTSLFLREAWSMGWKTGMEKQMLLNYQLRTSMVKASSSLLRPTRPLGPTGAVFGEHRGVDPFQKHRQNFTGTSHNIQSPSPSNSGPHCP